MGEKSAKEKIAHLRGVQLPNTHLIILKFPKAKIDHQRKDCTPERCVILSLRVYKAGRTLRDILPTKKKLCTLSRCAILSLRVFKTSIILSNFLPSNKTLHTLNVC